MRAIVAFLVLVSAGARVLAGDAYFPKGAVNDFEQRWYAKHLSTMQEPILSAAGKDASYFAFRILYLPTWGQPVAVRYEKRGNQFFRRSVKLSGEGGYDPGKIAEQEEIEVEKKRVDNLIRSLKRAAFWEMPEKDDVLGEDGSQLIIEAVHDGKYRVLDRWTPEYETEKRGLTGLLQIYEAEVQGVEPPEQSVFYFPTVMPSLWQFCAALAAVLMVAIVALAAFLGRRFDFRWRRLLGMCIAAFALGPLAGAGSAGIAVAFGFAHPSERWWLVSRFIMAGIVAGVIAAVSLGIIYMIQVIGRGANPVVTHKSQ